MALRSLSGVVSRAVAGSRVSAAPASAGVRAAHSWTVRDYKGHKLDSLPSTEVSVEEEELKSMFEQMAVIRRMETQANTMYREKKIRGFLHLYSGQEAIAVGMRAALDENDSIITAYRCHGWAYVMGWSAKAILGELYGLTSGCSRGKGGSMHMYSPRFFGGNGIVGAQVPVGTGVALAHQYKNDGGVCISLYGDGASNQGQVFEAYNIAKLWNIPCIFVCENNKFGMGTSDGRSSASTEYYTRGDYVPGIWVDAMDVLAVKEATAFAKDFAVKNGPIVMEMETYRYHGHSMSDPDDTYRSKADIKAVRDSLDSITRVRNRIVEAGWATEDELKAQEKQIRKQIAKESEEALAAPEPDDNELVTDIFVGEKARNIRGCDQWTMYSEK